MKKGVDGPSIVLIAVGSMLVIAGIKGWSLLAVVGNAVTGKPIAANVTLSLTSDAGSSGLGEASPEPVGSPQGTKPTMPGDNKSLGRTLAGSYGWDDGAEWDSLVKLWTRESSWNNHARNPSSGAYGIPQALPYTKMPKDAWPESAGGKSDPTAQINWGLSYIQQRYGSPVMAWAHSQATGWY